MRACAAWFTGFFPFAEIYVAVPVAMAAGLDAVSVVVWTAAGNITPLFLIHHGYDWLMRRPRIKGWLGRLSTERARKTLNRHGPWFVLVATPWVGVWAMALAAKVLGMDHRRFLPAATVSVILYAVALVALIRAGSAGSTSSNRRPPRSHSTTGSRPVSNQMSAVSRNPGAGTRRADTSSPSCSTSSLRVAPTRSGMSSSAG